MLKVPCFSVLLLFLVTLSSQVSLNEDLTLTLGEKQTLDKFRERVSSRLPHEYMRQDIFLVRWLRARKFKIDDAERLLMETLQWREKNKMDSVSSQDWSDMETDYRYFVEGCDLEGRPVISVYLGDWDIRKAVVAGKSHHLMKYIDKLVEEVNVLIRKSQEKGHNVTQFTLILDLNNYNLAQQGCAQCIPVQLHFLRILQSYYVGTLHKITLINAPTIFEPVLLLIKPLLSPRARQIFSLHGKDKTSWKNFLLEESSPSQLTKIYGGIKDAPFEMEYFKKKGYFDCSP